MYSGLHKKQGFLIMIDELPLVFNPLNDDEINEILENCNDFLDCDILTESNDLFVGMEQSSAPLTLTR